jgi:hypothetical protein
MEVGRESGLEPIEDYSSEDLKGCLKEGDGSAIVDGSGAFFGDGVDVPFQPISGRTPKEREWLKISRRASRASPGSSFRREKEIPEGPGQESPGESLRAFTKVSLEIGSTTEKVSVGGE